MSSTITLFAPPQLTDIIRVKGASTRPVVHAPKAPDQSVTSYPLAVSEARKPSQWKRAILGPQPVYKLNIAADVRVPDYLPTTLTPFPHQHPNFEARLKRTIGFADKTRRFVSSGVGKAFHSQSIVTESDLLDLLQGPRKNKPVRYNVVVTAASLVFVKDSKWPVSKHAFSSVYEKAYFAGDMWKDAENRLHFRPNSGTYLPSDVTLSRAAELIRTLLPHVSVVEEHFAPQG